MKNGLIVVGKGLFIFAVLVGTMIGVGAAARAGILVIAAIPFALVLILILRQIGPRAEQVGWAVFLSWLGLTYLTSTTAAFGFFPLEIGAFVFCTACALLGVFVSPWFLAVGFLAHVGWDFLPRTLPDIFEDLPLACLIFDTAVALYIGWRTRNGRFQPIQLRKAHQII